MSDHATIEVAFRSTLGAFRLDAAFTVPASGVTALFGPSGCGKTSVLRCIAGLDRAADGLCVVAGDVWQAPGLFRPTHRRPIGYVFQEASLFPHLSVRGNLLYGAADADMIHLDEITALLGLNKLLERAPMNLSGGERQRVAIGRALLSQPKLLLMDEPLSALDQDTKDEILPFIGRLQDSLSLPIVYVSHDKAEIERLADHLVLMDHGRVSATGPLATLQSDPTLPLAAMQTAAVSMTGVVTDRNAADGLTTLTVDGGSFLVPTAALAVGERRRLRILASDVSLSRAQPLQSTILNTFASRILSATPTGPYEMTAVLGLGPQGLGVRILARVTLRSWEVLGFAPGMEVYAQVKGIALLTG